MQSDLSAVLLTPEHLLSARIATRGQRLIQVLNGTNTDFVFVHDAQVFGREGGPCIATLPTGMVLKRNIALAIPTNERHESPEKRRGNFVRKRGFAAFLVVLGYEVRGQVWLRGADDPLAALCHELGTFFPVPHGAVSFCGVPWCDGEGGRGYRKRPFMCMQVSISKRITKTYASAG